MNILIIVGAIGLVLYSVFKTNRQSMSLKYIILNLLVVFMFSSYTKLQAQVTIGSGFPPTAGSLLQLKEDNEKGANSTRGLLLPRLRLTSSTTLIDIDGGAINHEALIHTGLTIFNLTKTAPFCKRVYVWSGTNWKRLGLPCAFYIGNLRDIDFGISAGDTKTISFTTNASWQYSAAPNYEKVITSFTKALNTIHVGGTEEKEETISLSLTSADFSPKAGSVQETKLTFQIAGESAEKATSINVKRTVPSYLNVLNGTSGSITRVTPTISVQAESNDKWSITSFINEVKDQTATEDNAPLSTKTLSLAVPTNESWDVKDVRVEVKGTNANTGEEIVKQNYNHKQEAWSLNYANYTNVANPVPSTGGNYIANMSGDYPGTINIRAAGNVVGTAGGATATASAKNFTVPPNDSWDGRNVLVEHERKPGNPWIGMFNTWQNGYTLDYTGNTNLPDLIPAGAGNYVATFFGSFIGPVRIRTRGVGIYETGGAVTASPSNRSFHVPTNDSWAARVIDIDFERRNEQWNHFISRWQSAFYWMTYHRNDAPNPIPYKGEWYQTIVASGSGGPVTVVAYINGVPSWETDMQYANGTNLAFYVPINAGSWNTRQIDVYIKKQGNGGGELVHAGTFTQSAEYWIQYSHRYPAGGIMEMKPLNLYVKGNAPLFPSVATFRIVSTISHNGVGNNLNITGYDVNLGYPVLFRGASPGSYTIRLVVNGIETTVGSIYIEPSIN